jgi:hypothetical protein
MSRLGKLDLCCMYVDQIDFIYASQTYIPTPANCTHLTPESTVQYTLLAPAEYEHLYRTTPTFYR